MTALLDELLFVILPYVAVVVALVVGVYRYRADRFSVSSFSSQFLEKRAVSWGSAPWHYGIIIILSAHIIAAVVPSFWGAIVANRAWLYAMEVTGWGLAAFLGLGLGILVARRLSSPRVAEATSVPDIILVMSLLFQVVIGLDIAVSQRWGALWYLQQVVPWLQSLVVFNPQVISVSVLPLVVKMHILNALFIIALIPFTRLVHMFTVPITYLWRPYEVVVWNRSSSIVSETRDQPEVDSHRRSFLKLATTYAAVAVAIAGALDLIFYTAYPPPSGQTQTSTSSAQSTSGLFERVQVANVADLEKGKPLYFNYPLDNEPNILVKLGQTAVGGVGPDNDIVAFSQVCQHLGCLYGFQDVGTAPGCDSSYKAEVPLGYCCCHGSIFDYTNAGRVLGGPSPRPVPQVKLEVDSSGDIFATGMGPPTIFGHNTGSSDVSADLQ